MTPVRRLALALSFMVPLACSARAGDAPAPKTTPTSPEVSYYRTVRPIFQQNCQGCHQPARAQGGYVMIGHDQLLKPGNSDEPPIVAGQPEHSLLVRQITAHDGKGPAMPKGKGPLSDHDVDSIRQWIRQGAHDDTPVSAREVVDADHPPAYTLPPVITSISYSPDSALLAVTGYHEVLLHRADGSGLVARLVGASERVQSVAFSPDGKLLAATCGDPGRFGEVQVWDVAKRKLKLSVPVTYDTVYGVSWSPDGSKIAFGCADNTLRAIDARTGQQVLFQGAHNDWVLETVFSRTGSYLVSVSRDRSMKLTEVATQRFVDNITSITPGALKGGLMTVARHPRRDELLAGGADGAPKIYKMVRTQKRMIGDDFNLLRAFEAMPGRIYGVRFSPDGRRFVAGSSHEGRGEARIYQANPYPPDSRLLALCGLPAVFTYGLTGAIALPDVRQVGKVIARLEGERGPVYTVAYRPDGKHVASAGFDGVVRLNDAETGKLVKEFVPVPVQPKLAARGGR
jgi:WD40 repeat protein